jgi:hypothetical protein
MDGFCQHLLHVLKNKVDENVLIQQVSTIIPSCFQPTDYLASVTNGTISPATPNSLLPMPTATIPSSPNLNNLSPSARNNLARNGTCPGRKKGQTFSNAPTKIARLSVPQDPNHPVWSRWLNPLVLFVHLSKIDTNGWLKNLLEEVDRHTSSVDVVAWIDQNVRLDRLVWKDESDKNVAADPVQLLTFWRALNLVESDVDAKTDWLTVHQSNANVMILKLGYGEDIVRNGWS